MTIQYGNYWYYIDNIDVESKVRLTMLSVVLIFKAGGKGSVRPLLTLLVGREKFLLSIVNNCSELWFCKFCSINIFKLPIHNDTGMLARAGYCGGRKRR